MADKKATPEYKMRYEKKRISLCASFNIENEQDVAMHKYAKNLKPSFSEWVKEKLKEDMRNSATLGATIGHSSNGKETR